MWLLNKIDAALSPLTLAVSLMLCQTAWVNGQTPQDDLVFESASILEVDGDLLSPANARGALALYCPPGRLAFSRLRRPKSPDAMDAHPSFRRLRSAADDLEG